LANTPTIPPIHQLLIICCKSDLTAEETQFLISGLSSLDQDQEDKQNTWRHFLNLISAHGVLPLAYQAIHKYAKDAISTENYNHLKQNYMSTVGRNMLMAAELIKVMALLEKNGIESLAFKGPTLAQMAYGDISLRYNWDLDLLIRKEQLEQAIELLKSQGYEPAFQMTPAQYKSYASISHDFCLYSPRGDIPIELHWRLFSNEFMVHIDDADFFANSSEVTIQGKPIKSFNTEQLLVYLATHGAKHQWERMEWLVDIARVIEKQSIDWDHLVSISEQTQSLTIVLTTLQLCQNILGTQLPGNVAGLTQEKTIQRKTKSMQSLLFNNFEKKSGDNIRTKTISVAQMNQLTGIKNKFLLLTSVLKPTPLDFESHEHPENMTFLYYFSRPINVFRRWKGKFFKNQ
jgi:hypothetical protein